MKNVNNIADFISDFSEAEAHKPVFFFAKKINKSGKCTYSHLTYAELDQESNILAAGLLAAGFTPQMRVVLMVKPSREFFILVFALFKAKIIPVIIDPGLEKDKLKCALNTVAAEGFIGIPLAQIARLLFGWGRPTIKKIVTVGKKWFWGGITLEEIKSRGQQAPPFTMKRTTSKEIAAILFTSGSTGIPKGTVYTHGNFIAQVKAIRETFHIEPKEVDLATFPLFALFDPILKMTSLLPDMDFSKPASTDPKMLVQMIEDFKPTNMFASPALLDKLGRYASEHDLQFLSLKRVISAGASVNPKIIARFKSLLNKEADVFTPYGATESLPVSVISGGEILEDTQHQTKKGSGICVGKKVNPTDVKIIRIIDGPIPEWQDNLLVNSSEIGEIIVKGAQVTQEYFQMPQATQESKIFLPDKKTFFHRMGDVGYIDEQDRIWYCGRKSQRIITTQKIYFTENCEGIFNQHPDVFRSALVGAKVHGHKVAVLCVELEANTKRVFGVIREELRSLAQQYPETKDIYYILLHKKLPVDIRHNAKISREKLVPWVEKELNK